MSHRLIIASNRLPVSIYEKDGGLGVSRSNGGLATALSSLFSEDSSIWVGWTGLRRELSNHEIHSLALPEHLIPVNLTSTDVTRYYDEFSNGILWPLAHGLAPTVDYQPKLWKSVQSVTEKFARSILSILEPGDVIWVHDYHLFLLPGILRKMGVTNRIGFFLHTPFFPLKQFGLLPHAPNLLHSLGTADLVGVQTPRDIRRIHQAYSSLSVPLPSIVHAFPIGIDADSSASLASSASIRKAVQDILPSLKGRTCIFSLSRLDYTKGILTQLKAFEHLITDPFVQGKVIYRLNVAPSRESALEYQNLRHSIGKLTEKINVKFGTPSWQPVWYSYNNMGPNEITMWYLLGDIHLNTPVADGMNLIAKEYIASRKQPGVLVISSKMGAARQLQSALIVPPRDISAIAKALYHALTLSKDEKVSRWQRLRREVFSHQASDWANSFLDMLSKSRS